MPYKIPPEFQYKETILFGLTFEQLAYAVMFLPAGGLLFFKLQKFLPERLKVFENQITAKFI